MKTKCECGGYILGFFNTRTMEQGYRCQKCGRYHEIKPLRIVRGCDYEEAILARQDEQWED